jgi:hypothetical protein
LILRITSLNSEVCALHFTFFFCSYALKVGSPSEAKAESRLRTGETTNDTNGNHARTETEPEGSKEPPFERHVFQTIFLDRDDSSHLWTENEIRSEKRIAEKWWKQQSHRWQHYARVVPWMMWINGRNNTQ